MDRKGAYKNCVDWPVPLPMGSFAEPSNMRSTLATAHTELAPHTTLQWWSLQPASKQNAPGRWRDKKKTKSMRKVRLWLCRASPNRKPIMCCTMKSWLKQTAQLLWQCPCDSLFLLLEKNNCHSTTTASYPLERCLQSTVRSTVRYSTACSRSRWKDEGAALNTGQYGHW